MRIITEIAGSSENRIVYEDDAGLRRVFSLPSVWTIDETRVKLLESLAPKTTPKERVKEPPKTPRVPKPAERREPEYVPADEEFY